MAGICKYTRNRIVRVMKPAKKYAIERSRYKGTRRVLSRRKGVGKSSKKEQLQVKKCLNKVVVKERKNGVGRNDEGVV